MDLPIEATALAVDRGTILIARFTGISHEKFFVVIGISKDFIAGFFYVNSEINTNVNRKPEQLRMQYKICCSDYPFLNYDSYIGATEIKTIPKAAIVQSLRNGQMKIKDTLKPQHLDELLKLVRSSKLFDAEEKETYFY